VLRDAFALCAPLAHFPNVPQLNQQLRDLLDGRLVEYCGQVGRSGSTTDQTGYVHTVSTPSLPHVGRSRNRLSNLFCRAATVSTAEEVLSLAKLGGSYNASAFHCPYLYVIQSNIPQSC
jgi:hypothetical protein